jgi:hypothetical protein
LPLNQCLNRSPLEPWTDTGRTEIVNALLKDPRRHLVLYGLLLPGKALGYLFDRQIFLGELLGYFRKQVFECFRIQLQAAG